MGVKLRNKYNPYFFIFVDYINNHRKKKDFDERIENIKKVTKEDIMNVAKKVYIHTEYILKGDSNEENSDE